MPTKAQHRALERILESQRLLYNAALEERIGAYRSASKTLTYLDQCKGLTEWRRSDPEASELPLNIQRATLKNLDDAYRGFFRRVGEGRKPGFPRFRGKGRFKSFGFREFEGVRLVHGRLRFRGMPRSLRVHWHRILPASSIKGCTLKRDGESWWVGFAVEFAAPDLRVTRSAVGVDVGISTFAALSDGGVIPSLRAARKAEKRLRRVQRAVDRKKQGSRGRRKARVVVARCHARTARQRREHLHQASARLVREYDAIAVERLNLKGLARSLLAKDVHDASWGTFISMLRYKAEKAGVRMIEVDPHDTTQDCSRCGIRVPKTLAARWHDCPACGLSMDRDLNAARNILNRAGVGPGLLNAVS